MSIGLGTMIRLMTDGGESAQRFASCVGKTITSVALDPDAGEDGALRFVFDDGSELCVGDRGRSCCESRYMTCDDDLSTYSGATLLGATVESVNAESSDDDSDEEHEIAFLRVQTSQGVLVCQTHNEHNGYYGGFAVEAW